MKRHVVWYGIPALAALAFFCDQATKWWFIDNPTMTWSYLNDALVFSYRLNTDMALSLPLVPWMYYPLVALVIGILIYSMVVVIRNAQVWEYLVIWVIIAGAISNLVDRWLYGGVVDFINISIGSVFNIADVYIVGGAIMWFILSLRHGKKISKSN